jgi:hypothetical protein
VSQAVITHTSSYSQLKQAGEWLLVIFAVGTMIMTLRLLMQYFSFLRVKKNSTLLFKHNIAVFQVNQPIIPFSMGKSIFINQHLHNEEELREIIRHEFIHVKQRHSADILLGELLCVFNWYNPFAWLIRRAIRINLEFITDNKVLEGGLNKKEYQRLLLKVIGISQFSLSTPFNFSSLKKRIAMMNKKQSAKVQLLRLLLLLPVVTVILLAFRTAKDELRWYSGSKFSASVQDTIPQPPPPPPSSTPPPPPPAPPALPKDVKSINITEKQATVTLKNGKVEKYDLTKPEDQETFQKKYGPPMRRMDADEMKRREMMEMDMKKRQDEMMQMQMDKMRAVKEMEREKRAYELEQMQKQKQEQLELLQRDIESDKGKNDEEKKLALEKSAKEMDELNSFRALIEDNDNNERAMREQELVRASKERERKFEMARREFSRDADVYERFRNEQMEKEMAENNMRELQENNMALKKELEMNSKNLSKEDKQKIIGQLEMQQKQLKKAIEDLKQRQQEISNQIQGLKKTEKKPS